MARTLDQMRNDISTEVDALTYWTDVLKRLRLVGITESPAAEKARDQAGLRARRAILLAADELRRAGEPRA